VNEHEHDWGATPNAEQSEEKVSPIFAWFSRGSRLVHQASGSPSVTSVTSVRCFLFFV
jgi:hypothetical protein